MINVLDEGDCYAPSVLARLLEHEPVVDPRGPRLDEPLDFHDADALRVPDGPLDERAREPDRPLDLDRPVRPRGNRHALLVARGRFDRDVVLRAANGDLRRLRPEIEGQDPEVARGGRLAHGDAARVRAHPDLRVESAARAP